MLARLTAALVAALVAAAAQAKEQVVPATFYGLGSQAGVASAVSGGMVDYFRMLNKRDGGIHGVRLAPAGARLVDPLAGSMTHPAIEEGSSAKVPVVTIGYGRPDAAYGRVFPYVFPLISTAWQQAAAMVRYIGEEEGGLDKLKGKKVALLFHDSAYGREPIAVFADLAGKYGYELSTILVPAPGEDQQPQWARIKELRPDWIILSGWGAMNPAALKNAARVGYPRARMLGVWSTGAEEDVEPAGAAAKGFVAAGLTVSGSDYPVIQDIRKHVYGQGGGQMEERLRIGSISYNRGVVFGILAAEAVRVAQERFGKGRAVTGEQLQWGLEHLDINRKRLRQLGATGLMPPLETSCADHEGAGVVRFMRWNGGSWNAVTDWMPPVPEDRKLVRARYAQSALEYAKEKGIKPRRCPL